jgi:hypothetical protein
MLREGQTLTESLRKMRRKVMASSERRKFGIEGCTTVGGVIGVIKLRDSEASRLRREIHLLDVRRSSIDTRTLKAAREWTKVHNEIQEHRMKLLSLVGEAPVGLQRNRGHGGRPATWRTAVFMRINVIAAALDDKPATVLREFFGYLDNTTRSRTFIKHMLAGFRQWRHRQNGK